MQLLAADTAVPGTPYHWLLWTCKAGPDWRTFLDWEILTVMGSITQHKDTFRVPDPMSRE